LPLSTVCSVCVSRLEFSSPFSYGFISFQFYWASWSAEVELEFVVVVVARELSESEPLFLMAKLLFEQELNKDIVCIKAWNDYLISVFHFYS